MGVGRKEREDREEDNGIKERGNGVYGYSMIIEREREKC